MYAIALRVYSRKNRCRNECRICVRLPNKPCSAMSCIRSRASTERRKCLEVIILAVTGVSSSLTDWRGRGEIYLRPGIYRDTSTHLPRPHCDLQLHLIIIMNTHTHTDGSSHALVGPCASPKWRPAVKSLSVATRPGPSRAPPPNGFHDFITLSRQIISGRELRWCAGRGIAGRVRELTAHTQRTHTTRGKGQKKDI